MRTPCTLLAACLGGVLAWNAPAAAQQATTQTLDGAADAEGRSSLFLGWQSEPAMDYGGRIVSSAQDAVSRAFEQIGDVGEAHPGLAPVWEFPAAAALLLLQHEVLGHGGRAREFSLSPSYSFGLGFSGGTDTARPPRDHEQLALIAAGGAEADGVLAHRLLLDAMGPSGVNGAELPLLMMAKLDLTLYVATAPRPRPGNDEGDFTHEYRHGHDVAIYLVGRQAARRHASATDVWEGVYEPDFDEARLEETWNDARAAALWNLLDPSLASAMVGYFREHVFGGQGRVRSPALHIGDDLRFTLGTRAALGPREVTRFLDLRTACRRGVLEVYLRDLDSGLERTWGYGATLHELRLGRLALSLAADLWDEPAAEEGPGAAGRWNATAEVKAMMGRWGVAVKVGDKSAGFFPGLPQDAGAYAGAGALARW